MTIGISGKSASGFVINSDLGNIDFFFTVSSFAGLKN